MKKKSQNNQIFFKKMGWGGNDFIIFDFRQNENFLLSPSQIKKISNRKNIGCDQVIIIKAPSNQDTSNCLMEIYNSDGSTSGACGNATRCVAAILFAEKPSQKSLKIQTNGGLLDCRREDDLISVNMGKPVFEKNVKLFGFDFNRVDVGNPHAVCFLNEKVFEKKFDDKFFLNAPKIEIDKTFPNKTNVEFAHLVNENLIEVRVWERGVGETMACGSGACAVAVCALKQNLSKSTELKIRFKGGDLIIRSNQDHSITMIGGYEKIFDGVIDEKFFN